MTRVLTHDIYTVNALQRGVKAFSSHCDARVEHGSTESQITISGDEGIAAELLNYILTLSAEELLS